MPNSMHAAMYLQVITYNCIPTVNIIADKYLVMISINLCGTIAQRKNLLPNS